MKMKTHEIRNDFGEDREFMEQLSVTTTFSCPTNQAMDRTREDSK